MQKLKFLYIFCLSLRSPGTLMSHLHSQDIRRKKETKKNMRPHAMQIKIFLIINFNSSPPKEETKKKPPENKKRKQPRSESRIFFVMTTPPNTLIPIYDAVTST